MTIVCTPDSGIPLPPENTLTPELVQAANAACETIKVLEGEGLQVGDPTKEDMDVAARIVEEFALAEDQQRQAPSPKLLSPATPAAVLLTRSVLEEYSHAVVERAEQLRHLVTNKLILETENQDPKVRIKALELIGKITEVGLFTERSEVVVTHQSNSELEDRLREKLRKLMGTDEAQEAEIVEIGGEKVDLAQELGLGEA
jgi:hypothetical protein